MPRSIAPKVATVSAAMIAALLVPLSASAEPGFSSVRVIPSILGAARLNSAYGTVSCPTPSSCTTVGPSDSFGAPPVLAGKATAVTESSGMWRTRTALPLPASASKATGGGSLVNAVSCSATSTCTAVGDFETTGGKVQPLIETENSGTWIASTVAPPGGAKVAGVLVSLACTSQGNCIALGYFAVSAGTDAMVAVEASGSWGAPSKLASPSGGGFLIPFSISCSSVGNCIAIAAAVFTNIQTAFWTETSGTWGAPGVLPSKSGTSFLAVSLACPTAATCLASGELIEGNAAFPGVATSTSGSWSTPTRLELPELSPVRSEGAFLALTCVSAILCEAAGEFVSVKGHTGTATGFTAGAATWANGTWSSIGLVRGVRLGASPAKSSRIIGLSCASATGCLGVGVDARAANPGPSGSDFSVALTPTRSITAPSAPASVMVLPVLHGVSVSWTPPYDDGGSPVTGFTATVVPGGAHCSGVGARCRIIGLTDGHRYRVFVRDATSFGSSPPRMSALVGAGAAPSAPHRLHVVQSGAAATVSWHPSLTPPGEPVRSYTATVQRGRSSVRICRTRSRVCTFHALPKGPVLIEVTATDVSGTSHPSKARIRIP